MQADIEGIYPASTENTGINNEFVRKLGTKNSSGEAGGIPTKKIKLSKKNKETKSTESVQTVTCRDYVYIKTSSLPCIAYEDDWDLGIIGEVTVAKTIDKDENKNNANCENRMTTSISKIGKLKHVREVLRELKEMEKKEIDYEKIKQDYLAATSRTKISMELNLDDYHRWLSKDQNILKESKTLAVLKEKHTSRWHPNNQANRQGMLKLVANPQVVLELILKELDFNCKVLDMKSASKEINRVCLTIISKPNWAFFGKGYTREEALADASQYAIQFFLLMCV